jgi:uncharacterized protein (TIGR03083 family)
VDTTEWPDTQRVRSAFRESAQWFSAVVDDIAPEQWSVHALGVWSLRELVGHCSINCTRILQLLDPTGAPARRVGPLAFWSVVLGEARSATHATIAENAVGAADDLGDAPASALRDLVTQTIRLVVESEDTAPIRFGSMGELALIDFLPSRIVEFVAHGLDVCRAIERDAADVPVDAVRLAAGWLAEFGDPVAVVELLLGRRGSPYDVFG